MGWQSRPMTGSTWRPVDEGMDRHYAWGLAIDAVDPDLWYVWASFGARTAHRNDGDAQAILYRMRGRRAMGSARRGWLRTGATACLHALRAASPRAAARSRLIAGLQNGDLLLTEDAGETWRTLHTGLDGLLALSESVT